MGRDYEQTNEFRGAGFTGADFTGARFRDCDLRGVKIVDSWLVDVHLAGEVRNLVVNEVDVTDYVTAELDRRHPERLQLRAVTTPDDFRAMWDTVERLWAATVARAVELPEAARHERVDGEWSFTETLRHLVFATDAWASRAILGEPRPYHRLGLPYTGYPSAKSAPLGIDAEAKPTYAEVLTARTDRLAVVRRIVDGLTEEQMSRPWAMTPAPGYPEEPYPIERCLRVVMREECEHRRYATRDLAVIEARAQH